MDIFLALHPFLIKIQNTLFVQDGDQQTQAVLVDIFFVILGAHIKNLIIIKVKILLLIK